MQTLTNSPLTPAQDQLFDEMRALVTAWIDRGTLSRDAVMCVVTYAAELAANDPAMTATKLLQSFARAYVAFKTGVMPDEQTAIVVMQGHETPPSKL